MHSNQKGEDKEVYVMKTCVDEEEAKTKRERLVVLIDPVEINGT